MQMGGRKRMTGIRPKNTKATFRRTMRYLRDYKGTMATVFCLIVVVVLANVGGTYMISPLVGGLMGDGSNLQYLWMTFDSKTAFMTAVLIILAVVYLVGVVSNYLTNRLLLKVSTGTLFTLRTELFEHMQTLPIKFFDTHTHGELMSRYTSDVDAMNEFIARGIPQMVQSALQTVTVFVMMFVLSWQLTLCVIAMLLCMLLVTTFFGKKAKTNFVNQQIAVGKVNGYVEEMVEGQKVIKAFNHESKAISEFGKVNTNWQTATTKANTYANMMMPIMGNLTHTFYAIIAVVGTLVYLSKTGADASDFLGTLSAFLILIRQISNPISQLSMQVNNIFMALAGAERIFEILDTASEVDDGYVLLVHATKDDKGNIVESDVRTGQWAWKHPHHDGTVSYTELKGDVRFENVTFGYEDNKVVLKDVSLYAEPGQKIAFVGSTGAGKTTITNLINRFYDIDQGKIRYDGINIQKIKKADLRHSLAMVLQDTHLFSGTVMDNIRYGNLKATDEQCIEAAKSANAHFFISHLPKGYYTEITGDGGNLSQGQRQLIAIARAAVAAPPVLILDEATSSIDTRTEWLIQKGMDSLMEGRTTFVIAHRLSTVANSNAIMVLEHGQIIERGSHEQLLQQKGKYYQLYTGAFELS